MTRRRPIVRRTALAGLLLAGLSAAGASRAQSTVSLYGLVDVTAGRFQNAGGLKVTRLDANGMSQSYLGLRIIEDLGAGLRARVQLESYLRPDVGAVGRFPADPFWGRSASIGFQGAFGTSLIGRNPTPLYQSTVLLNPFGDSFAFSPTMRQYYGQSVSGDIVWNNSLAYTSPDYNGVSFGLIGNLGEGAAGAAGRNVGANIVYLRGPLAATAAWQQVRNGLLTAPTGFYHQTTLHLGMAYDFGPAKLFGQFGRVRTDADQQGTARIYQLGSVVPIGQGLVRVSYGLREAELGGAADVHHKTLSLGYDHFLSKSTDIYGAVVLDRIEGLSSGRSLAAGMRVRF